jgi:hypothetical protein
MNLKKAALLMILCSAVTPGIANAKSSQHNQKSYTAKRNTFGSFFIRLITLGQKDSQ